MEEWGKGKHLRWQWGFLLKLKKSPCPRVMYKHSPSSYWHVFLLQKIQNPWWYFSSTQLPRRLFSTSKCTASCCLLRKWKLILVLAFAQPNLEANQLLLQKYKRLESNRNDFCCEGIYTTAHCSCGIKDNYFHPKFCKYHVPYISLFFHLGCSFLQVSDQMLPYQWQVVTTLYNQAPHSTLLMVTSPFITLVFIVAPVTLWRVIHWHVE